MDLPAALNQTVTDSESCEYKVLQLTYIHVHTHMLNVRIMFHLVIFVLCSAVLVQNTVVLLSYDLTDSEHPHFSL